ncbi:DUF6959 family protein [Nocardia sp. NPDC057272]|uniref:DUF6959 family protein n=1 Tax=Nocardia sp. NPDC057272 TaxID=3346079 RepID=UPI00363871A6
MTHSAEIIETQGDFSLVKWAGRKFPGFLLQGDSLSIIVSDLREVEELLSGDDIEEAKFVAHELLLQFSAMQNSYEDMMKKAGLQLPYAPRD